MEDNSKIRTLDSYARSLKSNSIGLLFTTLKEMVKQKLQIKYYLKSFIAQFTSLGKIGTYK